MESSSGASQSNQITARTDVSITKNWHRSITLDDRNFHVNELVQAIIPTFDPQVKLEKDLQDEIAYAKQVELDNYNLANSLQEYYTLIADKIYNIRKDQIDKGQIKLTYMQMQAVHQKLTLQQRRRLQHQQILQAQQQAQQQVLHQVHQLHQHQYQQYHQQSLMQQQRVHQHLMFHHPIHFHGGVPGAQKVGIAAQAQSPAPSPAQSTEWWPIQSRASSGGQSGPQKITQQVPAAQPRARPAMDDPEKYRLLREKMSKFPHAYNCQRSQGLNGEEEVQCNVTHCKTVKNTINHLSKCQVGYGCSFPDCYIFRIAELHYKKCSSTICNICEVLYKDEKNWKNDTGTAQADNQQNPGLSDAKKTNDALKISVPPTTQPGFMLQGFSQGVQIINPAMQTKPGQPGLSQSSWPLLQQQQQPGSFLSMSGPGGPGMQASLNLANMSNMEQMTKATLNSWGYINSTGDGFTMKTLQHHHTLTADMIPRMPEPFVRYSPGASGSAAGVSGGVSGAQKVGMAPQAKPPAPSPAQCTEWWPIQSGASSGGQSGPQKVTQQAQVPAAQPRSPGGGGGPAESSNPAIVVTPQQSNAVAADMSEAMQVESFEGAPDVTGPAGSGAVEPLDAAGSGAAVSGEVSGAQEGGMAPQAQPSAPSPVQPQSGAPRGGQSGPQKVIQQAPAQPGARPKFADLEKPKLIQQQLLMFLHAYNCQRRESQANGEQVQCKLPHCQTMKNMLDHLIQCKAGRACTVPHCISSRQIICHYKNCSKIDCPVCFPLKQAEKNWMNNSRTAQSDNQQNPGLSDAKKTNDALEISVPPTTQPGLMPRGVSRGVQTDNPTMQSQPTTTAKLVKRYAQGDPEASAVADANSSEATDTESEPVQASKKWCQYVTPDFRNKIANKLVQAIIPTFDPQAKLNKDLQDEVACAEKVEGDFYELANSRTEYYTLIAKKIFEIRKDLDNKRKKRELRIRQAQQQIQEQSKLISASNETEKSDVQQCKSNGRPGKPELNAATTTYVSTRTLLLTPRI